MLDSQEETDRIVPARGRCRSLDSLPRGGSDILLWFADDSVGVCDHVTGLRRVSDRQQATGGGGSDVGRCLSTSDLLTAGDVQCCERADDYDPSWCSVNNLETDCVSPRVSSNSLFSQLDAGTATSSDEVGDHQPSSYRLTAADVTAVAAGGRRTLCGLGDDQPMYRRQSRRVPLQAAGSQVPLRQLTAMAGGGVLRQATVRHDERRLSMAAATLSASCPSLVYDHRDSSHQQAHHACQMPPQTAEHVVSRGEEQVRDTDKLAVDGVLAPVGIITHSTGSGSRSPMQCLTARPSRSTSPPQTSSGPDTSKWDCAGGRLPVDDGGGRKCRQRGAGSSSATTAGRATQRLARTKCLQWLNSFDEDD